MGVKDLSGWIKKNHPQVIQSFPQRWASPGIRGKRIAIDATLLTTRFHFAISREGLQGKGGLIGWYKLISLMREHDVRPVAVWDRPGVRPWKADERTRRWTDRAINYARSWHEDVRADRISDLAHAFKELDSLSEDEQAVIRAHVERTSLAPAEHGGELITDTTSQPSPVEPAKPVAQAAQATEATDTRLQDVDELESLERIGTLTETITSLIDRYRASQEQGGIPTTSTPPAALEHAIDHLTELEELAESLPESTTDPDVEVERTQEWLVSKMSEIIPPSLFRESQRQAKMTQMEGEIIQAFLSTGGSMEVDPLVQLDQLQESIPETKAIYERPLNFPTQQTHADCRELLGKMGVPVIFAEVPYEAESLATSLAKEGLVDYVASEDSDAVPLGGPQLRNLSSAKLPLNAISTPTLLDQIGFTHAQFIDFCILLGNDAISRVNKVGPVKAFKLITEFKTIENVMSGDPAVRKRALETDPEYMDKVRTARTVFSTLPSISPENRSLIEAALNVGQENVDMQAVDNWLSERHNILFMDQDADGRIEEISEDEQEEAWNR